MKLGPHQPANHPRPEGARAATPTGGRRRHAQRRHAASGGLYSFTMLDETITLRLPEELYHRLAAAAAATRRSLEEILLHALRIGSPPAWDDAPPEHQAEMAAMDRRGFADMPPMDVRTWRRGMILSWSHARDLVVVHDAIGHPRDVSGHDVDEVVFGRHLQARLTAQVDHWYRDYVTSLDVGAR